MVQSIVVHMCVSFGDPYHDEMSILAPLQQCCRLATPQVNHAPWVHGPHPTQLYNLVILMLSLVPRVRRSLYHRLRELQTSPVGPLSAVLTRLLQTDLLYPILTEDHLKAIDRRHRIILQEINQCVDKLSPEIVLVDHWPWSSNGRDLTHQMGVAWRQAHD